MQIKTSNIQDGEPKHSVLSDILIGRIQAFKLKLYEVEKTPLEKTIDNFRYDRNPEKEIEIWEEIADKYSSYISSYKIPPSIESKMEIYKILLASSCCAVDYDFLNALKYTSKDEAMYINSYFQNKKPITVTKHNDARDESV